MVRVIEGPPLTVIEIEHRLEEFAERSGQTSTEFLVAYRAGLLPETAENVERASLIAACRIVCYEDE
jgi:hypothetical protein